jgi:hypothetical protein
MPKLLALFILLHQYTEVFLQRPIFLFVFCLFREALNFLSRLKESKAFCVELQLSVAKNCAQISIVEWPHLFD